MQQGRDIERRSRGGRHSLLGPLRRAATAPAINAKHARQSSHLRSPPLHCGLQCGAPHSAGLFGRKVPPTPLSGFMCGGRMNVAEMNVSCQNFTCIHSFPNCGSRQRARSLRLQNKKATYATPNLSCFATSVFPSRASRRPE